VGTKTEPGKFDCHGNALPDEPMFTVLARDPYAPALVRRWAKQRDKDIKAGIRPRSDIPMIKEARKCAADMEKWRTENDGKWRQKPRPWHVVLYDPRNDQWHVVVYCHTEDEARRDAETAHAEKGLTYGVREVATGRITATGRIL
jgi:hypothetical protein